MRIPAVDSRRLCRARKNGSLEGSRCDGDRVGTLWPTGDVIYEIVGRREEFPGCVWLNAVAHTDRACLERLASWSGYSDRLELL